MNKTTGKTRTRISFVMLGISLAALVIVYAATTIMGAWQERQQTPRLAVDSLVKALRTYHRQKGRFPADFRELDARVWKHKTPPDFGVDGHSLSIANYYYLYTLVDGRTATIWIIPTGPRRNDGATHFLLLTPDNLRRWKGAPLQLDEVSKLPPVPQYREMGILGMTEQQSIELTRRKM
ncbi:MAG: hypothetical protein MOB07_17510 [Acidobacteria bacterium]|nr:hypothetical protein [Acidobacteriota bacterium]